MRWLRRWFPQRPRAVLVMPDATEPEPDVDRLHELQGHPDAMRCHWCNRTKVRFWRALVCPVCDVPPKETT